MIARISLPTRNSGDMYITATITHRARPGSYVTSGVPRAVIAEAARQAPRVDADRMRADLDAVVDRSLDG